MQSTRYYLQVLNETLILFDRFSKKYLSNVTKIRRVGVELILSDRRTDMTKLTVAFRNFENESKSAYDFFAYR